VQDPTPIEHFLVDTDADNLQSKRNWYFIFCFFPVKKKNFTAPLVYTLCSFCWCGLNIIIWPWDQGNLVTLLALIQPF